MPKASHTQPDHTGLPSRSSLPNAAMAAQRTLNFDQIMPPPATNITQSSRLPVILLPSTTAHPNNETIVARIDSLDSFINIESSQAPATARASVTDHCSSLAIPNANKVHNFRIEALYMLEQLSTAATRITNNLPTVQTIDQIIGTVSNQCQSQQLPINQWELCRPG
uniref:Uncharacterized protein n=1 Tax=Romanomermis culicivorax TaxID=13658 RepID=A0A915IHX7_ROMCU